MGLTTYPVFLTPSQAAVDKVNQLLGKSVSGSTAESVSHYFKTWGHTYASEALAVVVKDFEATQTLPLHPFTKSAIQSLAKRWLQCHQTSEKQPQVMRGSDPQLITSRIHILLTYFTQHPKKIELGFLRESGDQAHISTISHALLIDPEFSLESLDMNDLAGVLKHYVQLLRSRNCTLLPARVGNETEEQYLREFSGRFNPPYIFELHRTLLTVLGDIVDQVESKGGKNYANVLAKAFPLHTLTVQELTNEDLRGFYEKVQEKLIEAARPSKQANTSSAAAACIVLPQSLKEATTEQLRQKISEILTYLSTNTIQLLTPQLFAAIPINSEKVALEILGKSSLQEYDSPILCSVLLFYFRTLVEQGERFMPAELAIKENREIMKQLFTLISTREQTFAEVIVPSLIQTGENIQEAVRSFVNFCQNPIWNQPAA